MRKFLFLAVMAVAASPARAAVITLVNQGFETGTMAGWSTAGLAGPSSATTIDGWNVVPAGSYMASLASGGAITVGSLETFFGTTTGFLSSGLPPGNATNGSGIYQDFTGNAGDVVRMYWAYVATDYYSFNDPAFAVVVGPGIQQLTVLASIWNGGITVGSFGATGWRAFTYVLPVSGNYRLGFGVVNTQDYIVPGYLFLDNAPGAGNLPGMVPEPATLALVGAGLLALGLLRRR